MHHWKFVLLLMVLKSSIFWKDTTVALDADSLSDAKDRAVRAVEALSSILSQDNLHVCEPTVNIHRINTDIYGLRNQDQVETITDSVNTITGAIGQYRSSDPSSVLFRSIDIVAGIREMVPIGKPFMDSLFPLLSCLLDSFASDGTESIGSIVQRLVSYALEDLDDAELRSESAQVHNIYGNSFILLQNNDKHHLSADEVSFLLSNIPVYQDVSFLEILTQKIKDTSTEDYVHDQNAMKSKSSDEMLSNAQLAIKYLNIYCKLAVLRDVIFTKILSLTSGHYPDNNITLSVKSKMESVRSREKSLIQFLVEPDPSNAVVLSLFQHSEQPFITDFLHYHNLQPQDLGFLANTPRTIRPLLWNNWYAVMDAGEEGWIRGSSSYPGQSGLFIFEKVGPDNHFHIRSTKWPLWFVVMSDTEEGWLKAQLHPGEEGKWKIIQLKDGSYQLSTQRWPVWFAYMSDSEEGWVHGWKGNPGRQGRWLL